MEKYKIATALIVNSRDEILLTKRAREPFKGKWALVSGVGASKIFGLYPEMGVVREVKADLGTESFKGKFFLSIPITNDPMVDENVVYVGIINEDEIKLDPVFSDGIKWVSINDRGEFEGLAFEHSWIIDQYLSDLAKNRRLVPRRNSVVG